MKEYEFEPNRWISFFIQEQFCIGRTMYVDGVKSVVFVTPDGQASCAPFFQALEPHYLKFKNRNPPCDPFRAFENGYPPVVCNKKLLTSIINLTTSYN